MCKNHKNCKLNHPASISLSLQHKDGNAFIPSFVDKIIQTGSAFRFKKTEKKGKTLVKQA